jgi:hypothetical protein
MVEASDHGYVLHTRRIRVTRYRINVSDGQLRRFAARERSVNGVEDFISKYYWSTFSLAVPDFAARNSGVFDYVEAPGDETLELLRKGVTSFVRYAVRDFYV